MKEDWEEEEENNDNNNWPAFPWPRVWSKDGPVPRWNEGVP